MSAGITKIKSKNANTSKANLKRLLEYIEKPESGQEIGVGGLNETAFDVWNVNAFSDETANLEMLALNDVNPLSRISFQHFVISWSEGEIPTREQAREASLLLLRELRLDQAIAKCGFHYDTENVHIHVAVVTTDLGTDKSIKVSFPINSAHRAAAKINYIQGWENDKNALYEIDQNGHCNRTRDKKSQRALPGKETEIFSAQRTAGDISRELIEAILKDKSIRSWDQLHERLAKAGVTYTKKGLGAVFTVNQGVKVFVIKASTVHKEAMLSKMEARFGLFQESNHSISKREPEPVPNMDVKVAVVWQQYQKDKSEHKKHVLNAKSLQSSNHLQQYKSLIRRQISEREGLKKYDWKGNGVALMDLRSLMAATHASQKVNLKHSHREERTAKRIQLKQETQHPGKFDDYLKQMNPYLYQIHLQHKLTHKDDILQENVTQLRKNTLNEVPCGAQMTFGKVMQTASPMDISNYKGEKSNGEIYDDPLTGKRKTHDPIINYMSSAGTIDFIDTGRRVDVINTSDQSTKAFMQLCTKKWKSFELTGSDAFKRKAVGELIKLGIQATIINPELRIYIQQQYDQLVANNQKNISSIQPPVWNSPVEEVIHRLIEPVNMNTPAQLETIQDSAMLAYISHSHDIGQDAKNQSLKDKEIAQRLNILGYDKTQIAYSINHLSPNAKNNSVHNCYGDRLAIYASGNMPKELYEGHYDIDRLRLVGMSQFRPSL